MDNILDEPLAEELPIKYAGFWIRVVATLIDGLISYAMLAAVVFGSIFLFKNYSYALFLVAYVIPPLYYALMESSAKQATLGKMAVGLKVTDMNGSRIGFGRALGRVLSKFFSAIILYFGFFMVGWDDKKQGLHDKICGTLVSYK